MTKTTQYHRLHLYRLACFAFLALGLFTLQFITEKQSVAAGSYVLSYATNVTPNDLLTRTNQERSKSSLEGLSLNNSLNQAAQAKAEHMIAHNYWSHIAPDGTTPWSFFEQADYNYINAGENLAYGFTTSNGAINGWMNSEGHRANILGDYKDVGFGQAHGPNYQGGHNTVIVALYGTSLGSSIPAVQATSTSALGTVEPSIPPAPSQHIVEEQIRIPVLTAATQGAASYNAYIGLLLISFTVIGLAFTHTKLLNRGWNHGYRYILAHPVIDTVVVGMVGILFLSASAGYIQ